jgi:hypothetical protein
MTLDYIMITPHFFSGSSKKARLVVVAGNLCVDYVSLSFLHETQRVRRSQETNDEAMDHASDMTEHT